MLAATLTEKGQVVIPADIRARHGLFKPAPTRPPSARC
ncbi:MAG: AbrB/MazE/SpoVT family DNA-binding domain-containing protein [Proteobacteria bacterium]|nr:AbrB/MazE/SpoVT family DNA-binding domain-containing protein [Pseudomonadota bacterium]